MIYRLASTSSGAMRQSRRFSDIGRRLCCMGREQRSSGQGSGSFSTPSAHLGTSAALSLAKSFGSAALRLGAQRDDGVAQLRCRQRLIDLSIELGNDCRRRAGNRKAAGCVAYLDGFPVWGLIRAANPPATTSPKNHRAVAAAKPIKTANTVRMSDMGASGEGRSCDWSGATGAVGCSCLDADLPTGKQGSIKRRSG
jgi:hypothetical protein